MTNVWTLEYAIEIAKIGGRYRSYDGTGGLWCGANEGIADAMFKDRGLARATAIILNAVIDSTPNMERAAKLVDEWHQEYFGLRLSDVALGELTRRIAFALTLAKGEK